ncbi:hypothetical protein LTR64_000109 [Lithohypha guttulata]|uniref:uncharacterized protein n=1 Tax=Lithohypha guttulata TaxID=1690604 RepID=UPI002DDEBD67|nr:hypothetical protein LTR51_007471 [Lithohypha guttulata]
MTIWIDAVCIDQANDEERSQQVRAMPSIYSSAHTVITWLGCADSNVTKLFHFLNDGDDQGSSTQTKPLRAYPGYIPIARLRDTMWAPSTESEKIATMMLKDHFSQFCALEYWSRLWIVPEALLASQSILMHANQTLPLAIMQEFVHFAYDDFGMNRRNNKTIHDIFGKEKTFHWVCVTKYDRNGEAGDHMLNSLPQLLNRYGRLQCTDVRDRVFALLAISISSDSLKAHINYKTSAEELFATLLSDKGYNTVYDKFELALGLFECLELKSRSEPAEGMLIKGLAVAKTPRLSPSMRKSFVARTRSE